MGLGMLSCHRECTARVVTYRTGEGGSLGTLRSPLLQKGGEQSTNQCPVYSAQPAVTSAATVFHTACSKNRRGTLGTAQACVSPSVLFTMPAQGPEVRGRSTLRSSMSTATQVVHLPQSGLVYHTAHWQPSGYQPTRSTS